MKNAEKCLLEIITKNVSENGAHELFNSLIKPDVDTLKKSSSKCKIKRQNILNVPSNIKLSASDGAYLNYSNKPSESEESIAERTKLRR